MCALHTHRQIETDRQTDTHPHMHTHIDTHTHTHTHVRTMHTHAHIHTHTHPCAYTHALTHTHTYEQVTTCTTLTVCVLYLIYKGHTHTHAYTHVGVLVIELWRIYIVNFKFPPSNFLNFMQILGKFGRITACRPLPFAKALWSPLWEILDSPLYYVFPKQDKSLTGCYECECALEDLVVERAGQ